MDTEADAEVRVWTHGQLVRLHGTTFLLDSITGIPANDPLSCDECWIGVPLTEVDSVFVQRHSGNDLKMVGHATIVLFLYAL